MHPFKLAHSYLCHTRAELKNDFIKRKYEASIQHTSRASLAERRKAINWSDLHLWHSKKLALVDENQLDKMGS